jgi:hypothetical protein
MAAPANPNQPALSDQEELIAQPDVDEDSGREGALAAAAAEVDDASANRAIEAMRLPSTQNASEMAILSDFSLSGADMDAVGASASRAALNLTRVTGKEWGGLIYQDADGTFHATMPITDGETGSVEPENAVNLVPRGAEIVADYHSHNLPATRAHVEIEPGKVDFDENNGWTLRPGQVNVIIPENPRGDRFSGWDKQANDNRRRAGYMADPAGHVHKYKPLPDSSDFDVPEGQTELLE